MPDWLGRPIQSHRSRFACEFLHEEQSFFQVAMIHLGPSPSLAPSYWLCAHMLRSGIELAELSWRSSDKQCFLCRYTSIVCPSGFSKLKVLDFDQSCTNSNLTCPLGSTCLCAPCRAIRAAPSIAYGSYAFGGPNAAYPTLTPLSQQMQQESSNSTNACARMHVCATFYVGEDAYLMVCAHTPLTNFH